jgi:transcription antitermination factor NusG
MLSVPVLAWFALRVRSQREFRVRAALLEAGTEFFLPSYDATVRWSDREKRVQRLFFPGYIFARFSERQARRAANDIDFVMETLGIGGEPVAIPPEQIDALKRAIESRLAVAPCPYVSGVAVTVKSGPLAGITGVVQRISGETLITVAIEFLRRAISVQLDAADLEAAA